MRSAANIGEPCESVAMQIANATFIVTGASSGLGLAVSRHLVGQHARVVALDLKQDRSEFDDDQILCIRADITRSDDIAAALREATQKFRLIHGLINCAGILYAEKLISKDGAVFDLENFKRCLDVNLVGTFDMVRQTSVAMMDNPPNSDGERGIIINTASIAASDGQIGQSAYAASKAAIVGMTLPLARELSEYGIRVMTVSPGIFDTPMFSSVKEHQRKALEQQSLFPSRLGKPSEFAALIAHTIENPMLNGEVIRLDAGLRM
jgi:NAD(P)-dependent dehydrogenase (short-subunit alcohol dehydrogenase family)